jgi:hypothetical protein
VTFAGVSSLGSDSFAATLPAGRNLRKGPAGFFVHGRARDVEQDPITTALR